MQTHLIVVLASLCGRTHWCKQQSNNLHVWTAMFQTFWWTWAICVENTTSAALGVYNNRVMKWSFCCLSLSRTQLHCLSFLLLVCLSVCLSVSFFFLSVCLFHSFFCLSVCLSISFFFLSVCFILFSVCLSDCLFHSFFCLSVSFFSSACVSILLIFSLCLSSCSHYPTTRFTAVADTPENKRLAAQSKLQSQVSYCLHVNGTCRCVIALL